MTLRVGFGFDAHRLVEGRPLVLGGVRIPFALGLQGHSDGDVLSHAVADALLGAAALGDIGEHFPDEDPAYRGISSLLILEQVREKIHRAMLSVYNVDATVVLERPRIYPYKKVMCENIAGALAIDSSRINVKATTTEGLGFTGRGEGACAFATAALAL